MTPGPATTCNDTVHLVIAGWTSRSCRPSSMPDAMEPGFHGVGTRWNRGFMAFQLARRTRTVMLMAPVCPESGCKTAPPGRGPLANGRPRTSRHAVLAGNRHHAVRPAERPFATVDDTLLDKKVINL